MNDQTLFKFQSEGSHWLTTRRTSQHNTELACEANCGILGDEMGLGKTAQYLTAIRTLVEKGKRFLILVPGATIIQSQRQWERWICDNEANPFGGDGLFAVRSTKDKLPKGMSVIASHSMMARHDFVLEVIATNFDGVIIDEGHKFGGRNTKRIKHLWTARNLSKSKWSAARIVLTGTPVRNYADEIYNLLHFVAPEVPYFRNFESFSARYLTRDWKALWNPGQFHLDIKPFYLRRTVAEVQKDLPVHRITKLYTEITDPYLKQLYNKELDALDNFINNGRKMRSGDEDNGPESLLGYLVKLRHWTGIAKAKEPSVVEAIADYLLSDNQRGATLPNGDVVTGNKVAIGLIHKFVADRLEKSLTDLIPDLKVFRIQGGMDAVTKDENIKAFQRVNAPAVILCNMEAGGAGIDGLQLVCSKSYIFERMWNGADELQFEKRISRTGQTFNTETQYTQAVGTVDQFYDDLVEEKRRITGNVEEEDYTKNSGFLRELATRVVAARLATS